jgi:hypothetical protein
MNLIRGSDAAEKNVNTSGLESANQMTCSVSHRDRIQYHIVGTGGNIHCLFVRANPKISTKRLGVAFFDAASRKHTHLAPHRLVQHEETEKLVYSSFSSKLTAETRSSPSLKRFQLS